MLLEISEKIVQPTKLTNGKRYLSVNIGNRCQLSIIDNEISVHDIRIVRLVVMEYRGPGGVVVAGCCNQFHFRF